MFVPDRFCGCADLFWIHDPAPHNEAQMILGDAAAILTISNQNNFCIFFSWQFFQSKNSCRDTPCLQAVIWTFLSEGGGRWGGAGQQQGPGLCMSEQPGPSALVGASHLCPCISLCPVSLSIPIPDPLQPRICLRCCSLPPASVTWHP